MTLDNWVAREMLFKDIEDPIDVDVATMIYNLVVKHRRRHPVRIYGCLVCEGFLNTIPDHFGLNINGSITVKEYRKQEAEVKRHKAVGNIALIFKTRTRKNGRTL